MCRIHGTKFQVCGHMLKTVKDACDERPQDKEEKCGNEIMDTLARKPITCYNCLGIADPKDKSVPARSTSVWKRPLGFLRKSSRKSGKEELVEAKCALQKAGINFEKAPQTIAKQPLTDFDIYCAEMGACYPQEFDLKSVQTVCTSETTWNETMKEAEEAGSGGWDERAGRYAVEKEKNLEKLEETKRILGELMELGVKPADYGRLNLDVSVAKGKETTNRERRGGNPRERGRSGTVRPGDWNRQYGELSGGIHENDRVEYSTFLQQESRPPERGDFNDSQTAKAFRTLTVPREGNGAWVVRQENMTEKQRSQLRRSHSRSSSQVAPREEEVSCQEENWNQSDSERKLSITKSLCKDLHQQSRHGGSARNDEKHLYRSRTIPLNGHNRSRESLQENLQRSQTVPQDRYGNHPRWQVGVHGEVPHPRASSKEAGLSPEPRNETSGTAYIPHLTPITQPRKSNLRRKDSPSKGVGVRVQTPLYTTKSPTPSEGSTASDYSDKGTDSRPHGFSRRSDPIVEGESSFTNSFGRLSIQISSAQLAEEYLREVGALQGQKRDVPSRAIVPVVLKGGGVGSMDDVSKVTGVVTEELPMSEDRRANKTRIEMLYEWAWGGHGVSMPQTTETVDDVVLPGLAKPKQTHISSIQGLDLEERHEG